MRFSSNIWLVECNQQCECLFIVETTTHQWILFITGSMENYAKENRALFNCMQRLIRVTSNRRLRLMYCTADRHKASCGLSATAELLVTDRHLVSGVLNGETDAITLWCHCCCCLQALITDSDDSPDFVGQFSPLFGHQILSMWHHVHGSRCFWSHVHKFSL